MKPDFTHNGIAYFITSEYNYSSIPESELISHEHDLNDVPNIEDENNIIFEVNFYIKSVDKTAIWEVLIELDDYYIIKNTNKNNDIKFNFVRKHDKIKKNYTNKNLSIIDEL